MVLEKLVAIAVAGTGVDEDSGHIYTPTYSAGNSGEKIG